MLACTSPKSHSFCECTTQQAHSWVFSQTDLTNSIILSIGNPSRTIVSNLVKAKDTEHGCIPENGGESRQMVREALGGEVVEQGGAGGGEGDMKGTRSGPHGTLGNLERVEPSGACAGSGKSSGELWTS